MISELTGKFRIFAKTTVIMPLFDNEPHIIETIYAGDNQAFASLYEKYREDFFRFFYARCSEERSGNRRRYRFNDCGAYLDELYQNSLLKLYNQIMTAKMFVDGRKIYIRKRDGSISQLTASLKTYIISIGKLTLKEMERDANRFVGFDIVEGVIGDDSDMESELGRYMRPIESSAVNVDPLYDLSLDLGFWDEDTFKVVSDIVANMHSPCKEIFNYYFWEKKSLKEISEIMPRYSSEDSVKNQKSRCHQEFKVVFKQRIPSYRPWRSTKRRNDEQ